MKLFYFELKRAIFKITLLSYIFISLVYVGYTEEKNNSAAEILFFYNPGCHHCLKFKNEVLPQLLKKTNREVKIKFLDISNVENYQFLLELEEKFPVVGEGDRPRIFVGDVILVGEKTIQKRLIENINRILPKNKLIFPSSQLSKPTSLLLKRFESFNVLMVAAAGFLDGINPCAFAVIVFFISFLTLMKYKRKEILIIGLTFVLAVFITYFLSGLGILKGLQKLAIFYSLAKAVNLVIGALSLFLGFLSFWDFYLYKKTGSTSKTKLKLPLSMHNFIHRIISKHFDDEKKNQSRKPLVVLSFLTFLVGIIIGICTAACTGQVYLPTIVFMLNVPDLKTKAFFYLVLYNLMYIFPLVVIFVVSLLGVSSKRLADWGRRNFGLMKILLGILFLILGIILIKEGI
jgi:cytochrome c biogenesis protein CcdA